MRLTKRGYFTINIVGMAAVMFLLSFIPEQFPDAFGDWLCPPNQHLVGPLQMHPDRPVVHWGFRHHLWMWTGVVMLFGNIVFLIIRLEEWKEGGGNDRQAH